MKNVYSFLFFFFTVRKVFLVKLFHEKNFSENVSVAQ